LTEKKFKIIAFDVDGTLVSQVSSWLTLHDHFQSNEQAKKNFASYKNGDIDYETFMRLDIGLWPKPLHIDEIKPVLLKYALVPNAKAVIGELSKRYEVVLISAGIDILVEDVAKTLGVKNFRANGIEINEKGFVTGNGIFSVDLLRKEIALKKLLSKLNFSTEECIAVGDSIYDKSFLETAGLGIAVGTNSHLEKTANYLVNDLKEILGLV